MKCSCCKSDYDLRAFERGSLGFTLLPPGPAGESACAQEFSNACACGTTTARSIELDEFVDMLADGRVEIEPGRMIARRVRVA